MNKTILNFIATIPANPGFFVLEYFPGDSGCPCGAIKHPVVAWAIEEGVLAPYPITSEGVRHDNVFVLRPEGDVERPNVDWFPCLNDWLECEHKAQLSSGK